MRSSYSIVTVLFCLSALASALPASENLSDREELESRATSPKCVTVASGNLVTSSVAVGLTRRAGGMIDHKPFALNANSEIAFYNTTKPLVYAEFQKCTPNWFGAPNTSPPPVTYSFNVQYFGRVYLPDHSSCLGIEDPDLESDPSQWKYKYVPKIVPCLNSASGAMTTKASIAQNFAYRYQDGRKQIFWYGSSTYSPPTYQTGCESGLLAYYQWLPNGYPIVGPQNQIQYVCNADDENSVAAAELL